MDGPGIAGTLSLIPSNEKKPDLSLQLTRRLRDGLAILGRGSF